MAPGQIGSTGPPCKAPLLQHIFTRIIEVFKIRWSLVRKEDFELYSLIGSRWRRAPLANSPAALRMDWKVLKQLFGQQHILESRFEVTKRGLFFSITLRQKVSDFIWGRWKEAVLLAWFVCELKDMSFLDKTVLVKKSMNSFLVMLEWIEGSAELPASVRLSVMS